MNSSEHIGELAKALAKAQLEFKPANKSGLNPHFKSKYAPLPEVIEVAKVLNKHGIAYLQPTLYDENKLLVETVLIHGESDQWVSGVLALKPQQDTPQGVGSAITYGRRFGLASLAGIVADEDDDGQAASTKPAKLVSVKDGASSLRAAEAASRPPDAHTAGPDPASPSIIDPVVTESHILTVLHAGFKDWESKRQWKEDNKEIVRKLPQEMQLRISGAFVASDPQGKSKAGVAP